MNRVFLMSQQGSNFPGKKPAVAKWLAPAKIPKNVPTRPRSNWLMRLKALPLTPLQISLRDAAWASPPPEPDPFTDTPVVHFGAHLWPVKGRWEWHAAMWSELATMINGRCIVGVATDKNTDNIEYVRRRLPANFEIFDYRNTGEGENVTFRRLQEMMPTGQNDVMIYAHGKGVRNHTYQHEAVRIWSELMYETVVMNPDRIVQKLAEGYKCFGSFRSFGDDVHRPINRWHYSGTFFGVRAKYLVGNPVKKIYGGVESWCGDSFLAGEAWNEFMDAPPLLFGYDLDAICSLFGPQMQWESNRIACGVRCEQHKRELEFFLSQILPYDRVLVIGSKHGGIETCIKQRHPGVTSMSIDIAPQADNVHPMIVGSSLDEEIRDKARRAGPYDVVFIDGDHTYDPVKADWEFALGLHPRIIGFHDIADTVVHRKLGVSCYRLWNEIKTSGYNTNEKIVGCCWGGIGIVTP